MTDQTQQAEREAFEAWVNDNFPNATRSLSWEAWQARSALSDAQPKGDEAAHKCTCKKYPHEAWCGDERGSAEPVAVLHPAPSGRHPECEHGCSHPARAIAGPCQSQCVKTPEFAAQSSAAAAAAQLRFATQIGANQFSAVNPARDTGRADGKHWLDGFGGVKASTAPAQDGSELGLEKVVWKHDSIPCVVHEYSSRICQFGTKSCVVDHDIATEQEQRAEPQGLEAKVHELAVSMRHSAGTWMVPGWDGNKVANLLEAIESALAARDSAGKEQP